MRFITTSRQDDLISLSYLMLMLLNKFTWPGLDNKFEYDLLSDQDLFAKLISIKTNITIVDMCN